MFIWFVFRDSIGSAWQSGLFRLDGSSKPAARRWWAIAAALDMRNATVGIRAGTVNPFVTAYVREFCHNNPVGAAVGSTTRVYSSGRLVGVTQAQLSLGADCTVGVQLPITVARGRKYVASIDLNAVAGNI